MVNDVTGEISAAFMPEAVLVAYSRREAGCGNRDYYLESMPVLEDGSVGAAAPVSRSLMERIAAGYGEVKRTAMPHGPVPRTLLYADVRDTVLKLVWWNAPQRRHLMFGERAGVADGDFNMPGVVYGLRGRELRVFAFAGSRPSERSRLLLGPFVKPPIV